MITVITIEGVLARGDDLRNAQPTKQAKVLYDGLHLATNMVGLTRADPEVAKWWLKREHFNDWSSVMSWDHDHAFTWDHWRVDQMRSFLADGWEIYAYLDTHAYVVDEVRALGVVTMCLSYPTMPPGWKEVTPPRAWSTVVSTMEAPPLGRD